MRVNKSIDVYMLSLSIVNLLMSNKKGALYYYTKESESYFREIVQEIKRNLKPKEQAIIDLAINRGIKPSPDKRISAYKLLDKISKVITSDFVEDQNIPTVAKQPLKRKRQTYANFLKISMVYRN